MKKCTHCGAPLDDDALFCTNCGAKSGMQSAMVCPSCGANLDVDSVFCTACGKRVDNIVQQSKNIQTSPEAESDKSSKFVIEIIVLVAIIALVVVCVVLEPDSASKYKQTPSREETLYNPESTLIQIANKWSLLHNEHDANNLSLLYANQVNYYQSTYTRDQIRASKEKLLNKYPEFRQEISNLSMEKSSDCYRISFDKKVWTDLNKAPKTYPSYLEVKLVDGAWVIITEGDRVTDENLRKQNSQNGNTNSYVVIDGTDLRLRLGPSTSADTFKWADGSNRHPVKGEKFKYLGESGEFYKIDFKGHELWVSKLYTHLE